MLKNNKDIIIITIIITVMVILSLIFIFNTIQVLRYREGNPNDIVYTSTVRDINDYQVVLKNNAFIKTNELDSNLSYVSSLVDYINTRFYYEYKGSKKAVLNYDYFIKANIVSQYVGDIDQPLLKPVWNKEIILLDHKKGQSSDSNIVINENLKIGLSYYNNLLTNFKTTLNLPLSSALEIKLVIRINGNFGNNQELNKEHYMMLRIPLDVKAFDITTSKNFVQKETIYNKGERKAETSYMMAIIYISLLIGIIYGGIYIIRLILDKRKSKYSLEKGKILKEYDDRIVTVSNFIKYDKLDVVDVPSFEELLNLSNEAYEPIIYWERREKGIKETWFTIIRNKVVYRYLMSKNGNKNNAE